MKKSTKLSIAIFAVAIGSVLISQYTSPASSNVAGAIEGVCGDPIGGNHTCNQSSCHTGGPTPPTVVKGLITTNVPNAGYVPGTTYTITAKIPPSPTHVRFGFEISPQSRGAFQGTLIVTDPTNTQLVSGFPQYITHKQAGTYNGGKDSISWTFNWTAPTATYIDSVVFYGAFNITNNSGDEHGDTIHTSTTTVKQDPTTGISEINSTSNNITVFPNPVKDKITISSSQLSESMQITVIDIYGKIVKELGNLANNQSVYVGDLTGGYYGLNIKTNAGTVYKKFIKE